MTQHPSDLTASFARLLLTQERRSPVVVAKHLGFSEREVRSTRTRYARDPETGYPSRQSHATSSPTMTSSESRRQHEPAPAIRRPPAMTTEHRRP